MFEEVTRCDTKHKEVLKIINRKDIELALSKQEKCLIMQKDNMIISGRSGTGKTTIILFKLLFSFLNFYTFKNEIDFNQIKWRDLFISTTFEKEKLKTVFTTYSNSLCFKVEELYENLLNTLCKKMNIHYKYIITNPDNSKLNSFREVENFPLFVNFRKLLFLIDGTIIAQFFTRENENKLSKNKIHCDIEFENNCEYKLNNYEVDNFMKFNIKTFFLRTPKLKTHKIITKKEINEDDFVKIFYEKELNQNLIKSAKNSKLIPSFIYAQINSVIKGSINSHLSYMNCITLDEYLQVGDKFAEINEEQRRVVYEIFMEYEKWKYDEYNNYFDIQDLVNHLIREVKLELREIKLIDYLFIDEVQDLAINQIYLLTLVTRYPLVYAGDTCQTITKSIRFRFTELLQIFHGFTQIISGYVKPNHAPLNENFRFGYNILRMSNFVSNLIFEIFPNSIDRFNTEFSNNKTNFLPAVLNNLESIFPIMSVNASAKNEYFTFAAFHCVICRTKDISEKLCEIHGQFKTSYIKESKGLEYECVIMYNFFKDSKFKKIWLEIFNSISIEEKPNEHLQTMKKTLGTSNKSEEDIEKIIKDFETVFYPKLDKTKEFNSDTYFDFCTELKEFYVGITRARTFLIFYDEDKDIFPKFVDLLTNIKLLYSDENDLKLKISSYLELNNFKIDKESLEKDGDKYFEKKKFKLAMYCYEKTNMYKHDRANAHNLFEHICDMKRDKDIETYKDLNSQVIKILEEIMCYDDIRGECLINLSRLNDALEFFANKKNYKKCAKLSMDLKKYDQASDYYDLDNDCSLAIDAILSGKLFDRLFSYIVLRKDKIDIVNIVELYKNYSHEYLMPYFYKIKEIKLKLKTNIYKTQHRIIFPGFEFLAHERYPSKYLDESIYVTENLENTIILDFKQSTKTKFDHINFEFLKDSIDLFKISNNN